MLEPLTTEARNPASEGLDQLSAIELANLFNAEDAQVAPAVAREAASIATGIEAISQRLGRGGRLIYMGAGSSGRLGVLDAAECPPTFNSEPWQVVGVIAGGLRAMTRAVEHAEDSPAMGIQDLIDLKLTADDVVVGIATSGRTPYVIGGIEYARGVGAYTIAISCNEQSEVAAKAELAITPIVGPEILSGSTRLKAGTATKLVLNSLSTGAMVMLGKTFGNLMVDLKPTNTKLAARAERIVSQATGLSTEDAGKQLESCEMEVKTAIVAWQANVSPEKARVMLSAAGGRIAEALALAHSAEDAEPAGTPADGEPRS